jgi:hypothetical protein
MSGTNRRIGAFAGMFAALVAHGPVAHAQGILLVAPARSELGMSKCPANIVDRFARSDAADKTANFGAGSAQFRAALRQLRIGLAEENGTFLAQARDSLSKVGNVPGNGANIALAEMALAAIRQDPALLEKARERLAHPGNVDSFSDEQRMAFQFRLDRTRMAILEEQARTVDAAAGLDLLRQARDVGTRLLAASAARQTPDAYTLLQLSVANLDFQIAELQGDKPAMARAFAANASVPLDDLSALSRRARLRERIGMRLALSGALAGDERIRHAQIARSEAEEVIAELRADPAVLDTEWRLSVLSGDFGGNWEVWGAESVDACTVFARMRIASAKAAMLMTNNAHELAAAIDNLSQADSLLEAVPAYRQSPGDMLALADALLRQKPIAGESSADVRAAAALRVLDAERRTEHCFCAFSKDGIAKIKAQLADR